MTAADMRERVVESVALVNRSGLTWPSRLTYGKPSGVSGLGHQYGPTLM